MACTRLRGSWRQPGRDRHGADQAGQFRQGRGRVRRHAGDGIPIKFVGVGERLTDFEPFDPDRFVQALLAPQADDDANGEEET